jgi:hypothetical protein
VLWVRDGEDERRRENMDERFGGGVGSTTGSLRPKRGIANVVWCWGLALVGCEAWNEDIQEKPKVELDEYWK